MPPDTLLKPMNQYEESTLLLQAISVLVAAIGVVVAIIALIAAFRQLKKMAAATVESQKANEISATAALIQVEMMVFGNLNRIDIASAALVRLKGRPESNLSALQMEKNGAIQNYLNSLDRLCACVLDGIYPENRARSEYSHVIDEAVQFYGKDIPDFEGSFPNIMGLRRHWKLPKNKLTPES